MSVVARAFASLLYIVHDEWFPLDRVGAVVNVGSTLPDHGVKRDLPETRKLKLSCSFTRIGFPDIRLRGRTVPLIPGMRPAPDSPPKPPVRPIRVLTPAGKELTVGQ